MFTLVVGAGSSQRREVRLTERRFTARNCRARRARRSSCRADRPEPSRSSARLSVPDTRSCSRRAAGTRRSSFNSGAAIRSRRQACAPRPSSLRGAAICNRLGGTAMKTILTTTAALALALAISPALAGSAYVNVGRDSHVNFQSTTGHAHGDQGSHSVGVTVTGKRLTTRTSPSTAATAMSP